MTNRLYIFLERNKLLVNFQSGFRRHRRTTENLLFLNQKILETFNRKKNYYVYFLTSLRLLIVSNTKVLSTNLYNSKYHHIWSTMSSPFWITGLLEFFLKVFWLPNASSRVVRLRAQSSVPFSFLYIRLLHNFLRFFEFFYLIILSSKIKLIVKDRKSVV